MSENKQKLEALYPFLSGETKDPEKENKSLLDSVLIKANDSVLVNQAYFSKNAEALVDTAKTISTVYKNNGRLFTMGNGGSSCDASHIAVEFLHPVTAGRPALTAINLVADTAMMTAVSNDIGYKHIYVRQLEALARKGDCLIGISTSGNSENLIAAFNKAKKMGLNTIGLTGTNGGHMAGENFLDHCLVVETDSIHRIQECHVATYHILWDLVHTILADARGDIGEYEL
tara:strand:- start:827 stop:1516 length:690 start_codon:yes stop_codon:yes gene_type:complete